MKIYINNCSFPLVLLSSGFAIQKWKIYNLQDISGQDKFYFLLSAFFLRCFYLARFESYLDIDNIFHANILGWGITEEYFCLYGKFISNSHREERQTPKMSVKILYFLKKGNVHIACWAFIQFRFYCLKAELKENTQKLKQEDMGWGP